MLSKQFVEQAFNIIKCPRCGSLSRSRDLFFLSCGHHICLKCYFEAFVKGRVKVNPKLSCVKCITDDVTILTTSTSDQRWLDCVIQIILQFCGSVGLIRDAENVKWLWLKLSFKHLHGFRRCSTCRTFLRDGEKKCLSYMGEVCLGCSCMYFVTAIPLMVPGTILELVNIDSHKLSFAGARMFCLDHGRILQFECLDHKRQQLCKGCLEQSREHRGCHLLSITPERKMKEYKQMWKAYTARTSLELVTILNECVWKETFVGAPSDLKSSARRLWDILQLLTGCGEALYDAADPDWVLLSFLFRDWEIEFISLQPRITMHKATYVALRHYQKHADELMEVDELPNVAVKNTSFFQ